MCNRFISKIETWFSILFWKIYANAFSNLFHTIKINKTVLFLFLFLLLILIFFLFSFLSFIIIIVVVTIVIIIIVMDIITLIINVASTLCREKSLYWKKCWKMRKEKGVRNFLNFKQFFLQKNIFALLSVPEIILTSEERRSALLIVFEGSTHLCLYSRDYYLCKEINFYILEILIYCLLVKKLSSDVVVFKGMKKRKNCLIIFVILFFFLFIYIWPPTWNVE